MGGELIVTASNLTGPVGHTGQSSLVAIMEPTDGGVPVDSSLLDYHVEDELLLDRVIIPDTAARMLLSAELCGFLSSA